MVCTIGADLKEPRMHRRGFAVSSLLLALVIFAAKAPVPAQGDFIIRNFKFDRGGVLPELKLHYRTLGTPRRARVLKDTEQTQR